MVVNSSIVPSAPLETAQVGRIEMVGASECTRVDKSLQTCLKNSDSIDML